MEHKQTEDLIITDIDEDKGIVEAIWAVMGNIDDGNDIIHPGAFKRTFHQRGNQINLLDNHRASSVMDSLGTVLELQEKSAAELPAELKARYPEATGGAWGKFQFLLDTPEGKGAFSRIKNKAVRGWSFGYDAIQKDNTTVTKDGRRIPVRNLREIKLYEISPVLFSMNEATQTTGVKGRPSEGKPWTVVPEDGMYNVYKLDEDGNPTGSPVGEHENEDDAQAQVDALYANEEDDKSLPDNETLPENASLDKKAGRVLSAANIKRIMSAMSQLEDALKAAGVMMEQSDDSSKSKEALTSDTELDSPLDDDTRKRYLNLIKTKKEQLELLEV